VVFFKAKKAGSFPAAFEIAEFLQNALFFS
jgi:hypothetical protein